METQSKWVKLFIKMGVATATVLACMFVTIILCYLTEDRSMTQLYFLNALPLIGIFLSITMGLTLLSGIPVLIEYIIKHLKSNLNEH
jgi:hypothetical protein